MNMTFDTPDRAQQLEQHRTYLMRFARSKLNDSHTAEDVVQDTMLAALAGNSPFLGNAALRTWLTAILNHKIVDIYRRNATQQTVAACTQADDDSAPASVETWRPAEQSPAPADRDDPCETVERRQLAARLHTAIGGLPPRQRDAFVLVHMHGYRCEQAARMVGVTDSNLWVILHRARKMLQSQLQGVMQ